MHISCQSYAAEVKEERSLFDTRIVRFLRFENHSLHSETVDPGDHINAYAEPVVNDLNHRIRPCLNGKTSCQVFFESGNRPTFTKRERRSIYDWVMERVEKILSSMNESGQAVRESAWRIAVESWLRSKGYIRVHINQKCRPVLLPLLVHE